MFIDITRLQNRSTNEFLYKNTIVLDEALYKNTDIRKLSPVEVSADIKRITDTSYKMSLEIKGEMTLPCSITLNDVIYPFDIKTEVKLSNEDEEDEEYVKIIQNNIDIISIIWQNIVLEIPLRVVSEDANNSPVSGEGWKLIREDESNI
jgi:uncharacterized protein